MVRKRTEKIVRPSSPAMLARNKIGTLTLKGAPEEEIAEARKELAVVVLESQIKAALEAGITHGKVAYLAKKLAGAK